MTCVGGIIILSGFISCTFARVLSLFQHWINLIRCEFTNTLCDNGRRWTHPHESIIIIQETEIHSFALEFNFDKDAFNYELRSDDDDGGGQFNPRLVL